MSPVRTPDSSVTSTACSMAAAASNSPRWRSIMTAVRTSAVGLMTSLPAYFGAEPWTASKIATSLPMFALGAELVGGVVDDEVPRLDIRVLRGEVLERLLQHALGELHDVRLRRARDRVAA